MVPPWESENWQHVFGRETVGCLQSAAMAGKPMSAPRGKDRCAICVNECVDGETGKIMWWHAAFSGP